MRLLVVMMVVPSHEKGGMRTGRGEGRDVTKCGGCINASLNVSGSRVKDKMSGMYWSSRRIKERLGAACDENK